jgi:GH15 family glucan-1,4-alpha-glucosidase
MAATGEAAFSPEAIASYGLLADCNSAALVSRRGSIDWLCFPRYDSPSVFGRLLDPEAGHWAIGPTAPFSSQRHYEESFVDVLSRSNVVRMSTHRRLSWARICGVA